MLLGEIIKKYRTEHQMSLQDFADLIGTSRSYIYMLEKNINPSTQKPISPSIETLKSLAKAMNMDLDYLLKQLNDEQNIYLDENEYQKQFSENAPTNIYEQLKNIGTMYVSNTDMVKIPILGVVKAGYDYLAQENWIGSVDVEKNIVSDGSEYFALKVVGDSMSPVLIQDDIVVIKKQNDFENGDIVVAIVNGNEATIKKGKKTDSSITLQPLNPSYDPLVFTYDEVKSIPVTIVGIVKQLKRDF